MEEFPSLKGFDLRHDVQRARQPRNRHSFHPSKGSTYVMTVIIADQAGWINLFPSLKGFDLRHDHYSDDRGDSDAD